ncbi:MAG: LysR substrate-binding domain-containing protein [Thiolinea sp.]
MHAYADLLGAIDELCQVNRGHLAVAVTTTANHFVTKLLAAFSAEHRNITVALDVSNRQSLLHQLMNQEPDLVIMGEPPRGYDSESERLMTNPLVVIAAPDHALAGRQRIALAERAG